MASNELRVRSIAILEKISRLTYSNETRFEPLHDCQRLAAELRSQIEEADPDRLPGDAAKLAGGDHPFVDLLDLTENQKGLDDEEFSRKERSILGAFGDPLRLAVLRGRITVITTPNPREAISDRESANPPLTHDHVFSPEQKGQVPETIIQRSSSRSLTLKVRRRSMRSSLVRDSPRSLRALSPP